MCREGVAPRVRRSEGLGGVAVRARAVQGGTGQSMSGQADWYSPRSGRKIATGIPYGIP